MCEVGIAQRKNKCKTSIETKQIYFNMKDDLTTDTWYVTVATGREMIGRYSDKVGWIFIKCVTEIHYVYCVAQLFQKGIKALKD